MTTFQEIKRSPFEEPRRLIHEREILEDRTIPVIDRLIYTLLRSRAGRDGTVVIPFSDLAAMIGRTENSIQSAINRLRDRKIIATQKSPGQPLRYTLLSFLTAAATGGALLFAGHEHAHSVLESGLIVISGNGEDALPDNTPPDDEPTENSTLDPQKIGTLARRARVEIISSLDICHKQHSIAGAREPDVLLLISELTHYGVDDAQLLVDRHGVERCRQQLAAMPARITEYARRGRPIANPPGYLRLAIERGYRIPDAVATAAVREKVAAQQRQREAAELEDAQYRAAADKILAELAPATMARFRARAEEQIRAMNPIMRRAPKIPDGLMRSQLVKIVAGAM